MNEFTISSGGMEGGAIHTAPAALSIHKYLPMAVLYFFLNSAGLPTGLFYTTILSPLFFLWLYLEGRRWLTLKFLVCLSPFVVAHFLLGIESPLYYVRSSVLLWTVYVTVHALYWALLKCRNIERLFEQLIVLNFCAAMAAVALIFTPLQNLLWHDDSQTIAGPGRVLRLQLLTSEPSVYANLMSPLLIFTLLRLVQTPSKRNGLYVAMIAIPFLLCQSFGGLAMSVAGLGIAFFAMFRRLLNQRKALSIFALAMILIAGLLIVPNPIAQRVFQVAVGSDSSTYSRTTFSFIVAYTVAASKSLWWGVGLGQGKLVDVSDLGLGFSIGIIPNAIAGTFAELGIIAVLIKFIMEFYLFFRTRVYTNTFRLAMFVIAFIVQLTGSHLMNVQEYLMWCFAFAPFFPAMNLHKYHRSKIAHV